MSTEPFIGEIKIFGFDFAPRGYMSCSGQLLSIAKYGGNGQVTYFWL